MKKRKIITQIVSFLINVVTPIEVLKAQNPKNISALYSLLQFSFYRLFN